MSDTSLAVGTASAAIHSLTDASASDRRFFAIPASRYEL